MVACAAGLVWLSTGCASQVELPRIPAAAAVLEPTPTPGPSATPTLTGAPQTVQPSPMPTATPDAPLPMRFALWTIEAVSAEAEGEAGEIFGRGLEAFEDTYPDVTVAVALKNESGKGGILDYLRTASEVSPSVLPDLVVLSTTELAQAARSGLVVPLEDWISPALVADLLPAARQAATVDGQLVGIPFEMDLEHLIYNTNKLSATPITWTDVISSNTTYVFPAKGRNGLVNDSFLVQYLALNGRLQDDDGRPWLDEQALRSVLGYYWMGVERGVIPPNVLSIGAPEDIWPSYVSAEVGIVHVTSHHFLRDRGVLRTTQFAAIPTRDGTPLTIARGRALAVVTRVPERQAVAARLIEFFMAPDNNAAWNQTRAYLPTRYAAFSKVGQDDPYWPFLQQQLEVAVPPPAFPEYDQIGRVLQQSVVEVLSGEARPEDAAAAALDAIVP